MYSDEKWWKVFSFTIAMMADGCVKNLQILFSDIAGSIDYIWRSAKQKPNKQSILSQLQKKKQYKDITLSCLGEDVDNCLLAWKLYVKFSNSDSLFVSESVDTTTKISQNNDNLIYDSAVLFIYLFINIYTG